MAVNRFPRADRARRAVAAALLLALVPALQAAPSAAAPLVDAPVAWHAADRDSGPMPKPRDPSLYRDAFDESFVRPGGRLFHPVRLVRQVGTWFGGDITCAASDVNALDEVIGSTWFTNRIGLHPMTPEEVARGAAPDEGPDRSAPWRIMRAKSEGVTPGFNVEDARGQVYVIKFDPPCCPGGASAAGAISGRLLHAAGYNVPADFAITFRREDVVLGPGVTFTDASGQRRPMTEADVDSLLSRVTPLPDGAYRAAASRYLEGRPLGPFDWKGRRKDDPADRVNHENRRELRGLRMICAWIAHFDTKQHNTLDMWVEEDGRHFVRHHLIDFASTLGMGAGGPFPLANMEYGFDLAAIGGRSLSLGLATDAWHGLERPPGLDEVGYFDSTSFEPMEWKPLQPNAAFANLTERDGYWAAKVISAFRDEHIDAAVAAGGYRDPAAARHVARTLGARRDRIARLWFDRVPPLDFFRWDAGAFGFHDLGAERGIYPGTTPRYRVRLAACTADRDPGAWTPWVEADAPSFDLAATASPTRLRDFDAADRPFLAIECSVRRDGEWSRSVRTYVAPASGRVISVER